MWVFELSVARYYKSSLEELTSDEDEFIESGLFDEITDETITRRHQKYEAEEKRLIKRDKLMKEIKTKVS